MRVPNSEVMAAGPIVYRGLLTWITLALLTIFTIIYFVVRRRRK